jgi:hypothetical protein
MRARVSPTRCPPVEGARRPGRCTTLSPVAVGVLLGRSCRKRSAESRCLLRSSAPLDRGYICPLRRRGGFNRFSRWQESGEPPGPSQFPQRGLFLGQRPHQFLFFLIAGVAQLVERRPCSPVAAGSIPAAGSELNRPPVTAVAPRLYTRDSPTRHADTGRPLAVDVEDRTPGTVTAGVTPGRDTGELYHASGST